MLPFVRSAHNYDMAQASLESGALPGDEPSLAQQQFKDEVDINTIVRRFGLTGQLPVNGAAPAYGDFDHVVDYHSAMNMVRAADEAFMALPADVRYRFANDPQRLMDFFSDPSNREEAAKLGLTHPLKADQPLIPTPAAASPPVPPPSTSTNT